MLHFLIIHNNYFVEQIKEDSPFVHKSLERIVLCCLDRRLCTVYQLSVMEWRGEVRPVLGLLLLLTALWSLSDAQVMQRL